MSKQKIASYTGLRKDVISIIKGTPLRVLDVGCSNGVLLDYLKSSQGVHYAAGIEFNEIFAREAAKKADDIFEGDLDAFNWSVIGPQSFDLLIFADILEHTKEPAQVLRNALKLASKDAQIVISLPNIQHWTTLGNLLLGKWPQRDRGLFDKTHLRFFTLNSIYTLASECGLVVESIHRNYRFLDTPGLKINRLAKILAFPPLRPFMTYQYVVRMRFI